MRRWFAICLIFSGFISSAQHPVAFATQQEMFQLKSQISKYPLLQASFTELKKNVDPWLVKEIDVPVPKDPGGGYTHDRHKENYSLLFNSGLLYQLTGDKRYATLSKNLLLKYAALNPTLKNHPKATSSSPGHLFWQALNDANWLVYSAMGYDLVYNFLSPAERKRIEEGAFKPEVDFITGDLESWFNLIHNHGVWACAGVGLVGIATNNQDYIDKALYGTKKDGKSGFIAQLDNLFSPDGYYTEGPYYVRYALLPFFLFANALNQAKPELKIFEHRNQILRKALLGGLQQTNIDGKFLPLNDAIKDKDFTTNEMVMALDIAWHVYGKDRGLLAVARKQNRVLMHSGGAAIASELSKNKNIPSYYPYQPIEFTDGAGGKDGGVSILRMGKGEDLTTLVFKYASHGLSHGHFDRLGYFLFDQGNEILQDYGSVRFVNVEQKDGGRYLPENDAYAAQTIAHNTVVVDEKSHFDAKEKAAESSSSIKVFSRISPSIQVVSAKEEKAYSDVQLFRTVYLLKLPGMVKPLMIDIFRTLSGSDHQFDLPFQFKGQLIKTSFPYKSFSSLEPLGKKNGYQFLWKEAEAEVKDTMIQFTFLNERTYYSISSLITDPAALYFTRTGANDPNFNLRREPSFIIRKKGRSQNFISVMEIHGGYDPVAEFSTSSYPGVEEIQVLQNNDSLTVVKVSLRRKELIIAQINKEVMDSAIHNFNSVGMRLSWTGQFGLWYEGKKF